MALDPKIVKMLNDYADSQPALRLPAEPHGSSNPKLGTALDEAIDATVAGDAGTTSYEPDEDTDWSPAPATVGAALDQLAARLTTNEQLAADPESQAYTAGDANDWDTAAPASIKEALDRMADAVAGLLTNPIP